MREPSERVWHNVRPNETTRLPRRHVFIDTEAQIDQTRGGHEQTWRLGVACFTTGRKGRAPTETWADYESPQGMWEAIAEFGNRDGRTIVWAHNLGYDARIANVFGIFPAMGFRLTAHNISPRGTWLEWKRDRSTILMTDSVAVFSTTIAKIGEYFGLGKVNMAMDSLDNGKWLDRCRSDVRILKTAILAYLDWLERDDMGNWQLTGAGQSWASFRHKFLTHKMVVHDDELALAAERRAMWAGRCEAYWHGELNGQTVHEWDFTQAYVRIARDHSVPVRLLGPMPKDYDWTGILDSPNAALLAHVHVKTELPVAPASHDGRILWPIGEFDTTLWDVEIKALIEEGAEVTVKQGWLYRTRPALKAWAEWIIDRLNSSESVCPTWQKSILKHWSRALIGRMAMTYNTWEEWATSPDVKVMRATVWDIDAKEEFDIMQVGDTVWRDAGRVEWPQSMPMVTGYVQAISRVRLWQVLRELPPKVALYADTDSLLCTAENIAVVDAVARKHHALGLRLKRSWDGFAIYGPRQIVTGRQVRVSGVPSNAAHVERGRYAGETWDTLPGALRRGNLDRVVTRDREWHITGVDHRRAGPGIGWTVPIRLGSPEAP